MMHTDPSGLKVPMDNVHLKPGQILLRMATSEDERRRSNVRWSVVHREPVFTSGDYPQLSWNLYDCRPDVIKDMPPTPDVFFRTIKQLGHGSFGTVQLVELKITGERLAMKVMNKQKCPRSLRMKELNAYLLIGESPFIVRFHSCFETDDSCYLLMQYHCGGSLAKIIDEFGLLSEETARFFTAEISEGLFHLHSLGIIHRDIKLANLLLGVDNHVRICDMGLCKLGMVANTKTHTRCGALRYCAPEVLNKEWYSKEVDWWSLGVVLYRMLSGQYPFDGLTREAIEDMIKYDEANLYLIPDGDARNIIKQFLMKTSSERLGYGMCERVETAVRQHPFFSSINWQQLQTRRMIAPSVQKRFMRKGSILRRLAFGIEDPKASGGRLMVGRVFQVLLRLLVLGAILGLVLLASSEHVRHAFMHYITRLRHHVRDRMHNEAPTSL